MWWLWTGWVFAACPEAPAASARASAAEVLRAFEEVEEAQLRDAHARLDEAIPCIRELLDARDALALHRAYAVVRFVQADPAASRRSWAAVRRLDPLWVPSEELAPSGHPIRTLFTEAVPRGDRVAVEVAPPGGWRVDGTPDQTVPQDSAFVLQGLDADGNVVLTGYFASPAAIPLADARALAALPRVPTSTRRVRRWGSIAAGTVLAAGVGVAIAGRLDHVAATMADYGEVRDLERRGWTRIGVGAVTAGVGLAGGVVVWAGRW